MKRLWCVYTCSLMAALMLLLVFPARVSSTNISKPLSVLPYNIKGNPFEIGEYTLYPRIPGISALINAQMADVVCLQECWAPLLLYLPDYETVESRVLDKAGVPIFYNPDRLELLAGGRFPLPGEHADSLPRGCGWAIFQETKGGECFVVFNVHLDATDQAKRIEGLEVLSEKVLEIAGSLRVILMGDFNIAEGSRELAVFKQQLSLTDAYRTENPIGYGATFQGFGKVEPRRIDYVLLGKDLRALSARVITVKDPPSDHNPVIVEIE